MAILLGIIILILSLVAVLLVCHGDKGVIMA